VNIFIIAQDFKPNPGGIAEYTHQLAKGLHRAGESVLILAQEIQGAGVFDSGVPYKILRSDFRCLKQMGIRGYRYRYAQIQTLANQYEADVLICNAVQSEIFFSWVVSRLQRIPFCVIVYGQEINKLFDQSLPLMSRLKRKIAMGYALRHATQVICISRYTGQLVKKVGVTNEQIFWLPPGLSLGEITVKSNADRFKRQMGWEGKKIILTVSRLVERKGIDTVVQSLPLVLEQMQDTIYAIVGEGPDYRRLRQLVSENGVEDYVYFAGHVTEQEKHQYYQSADVFVMPNRQLPAGDVEGFGIVFLEANAHEKPVVGGRSGGTIDAIEDEITGLLVDPTNVEAVAAAIIQILEDDIYAYHLGKRGKRRVVASFTWNKLTAQFQANLEKLTS
jgi:phosphatidylinositol alpha-1,6-mannosyltransferase